MNKEKCDRDIPCRDPEIKDAYVCCIHCERRQGCSAVCTKTDCNK